MALPFIDAITPPNLSSIASDDFITIKLGIDEALDQPALVVWWITYPGLGVREVLFQADYSISGFVSGILAEPYQGTITHIAPPGDIDYIEVRFRRIPRWPDSPAITIAASTANGFVFLQQVASFLVLDPAPPVFAHPDESKVPFVTGGFVDDCGDGSDQDYFLRVLERAYPESYLRDIRVTQNGGYELFQAPAKVGERVSLAIARLDCNAYVFTAHGGQRAVGAVEFYNTEATFTDPPYKLLKGTEVIARGNRVFILTEDVEIDPGVVGPFTGIVQAEATGYEYNVPGAVVTASGITLPGDIDTLGKLYMDVPTFNPKLRVRNVAPTVGGQFPGLDAIGNDVGVVRNENEPDDVYRLRITETPDTVSLGAIKRAVDRIFLPLPYAQPVVREVGVMGGNPHGYPEFPGMFFDAGSSSDAVQDPNHNFAYDMDPALRPEDTWKLLLSYREMRGFFLIGVPTIPLGEFGMLFDTTTAATFPVANAFDTIALDADRAAFDGYPTVAGAYNKALYDLINAKRAGGVLFDFYKIQ